MKKLTLEITEKYATIITLTVLGGTPYEMNASTGAFDLKKTDKITISNDGKMIGTAADATPAADAGEVMHGKWGFDGMGWTCSECGEYALGNTARPQFLSQYCPHCGVKMDGER